MSVNVTVNIDKAGQLGPYFDAAISAGLDSAAKRIKAELVDHIPVDTGLLRKMFIVTVLGDVIRLSWNTDYAAYVDGGVPPHLIIPKSKEVLKFGNVFTKSVNHPGQAPQNFTTIIGTKALEIIKAELRTAFVSLSVMVS